MILKFKHEDKVYSFNDENLSLSEARFAKRVFGLTTKGMLVGMRDLDVDAVLAVFSIALRRGGVRIDEYDDIPLDQDDDKGFWNLLESIVTDDGEKLVENRADRRKTAAKG